MIGRTKCFFLSEDTVTLLLGVCVFAVTVFVSAGHFHTADEVSMLVTAVNIADRGEFHTNQLGWGQWAIRPGEEQGTVTNTGDIYSKKSPLVILLMVPLVYLARLIPGLGLEPAVLLLGQISTAFTAVLIYRFARRLGYTRAAGLVAALSFALATMALVYSRSAMREVVASLGLLLALFALHTAAMGRTPRRVVQNTLPDLACGAGLALAMGANLAYTSIVPVFAAAIVVTRWKRLSPRHQVVHLSALALPIIVVVSGLAAYNYYRYGSLLETGYSFKPGQEGFTSPLVWAVSGLLFSPARGLLWYNPTSLLAVIGFFRFRQAHPVLAWTVLVTSGAQIIIFGMWWEWWGGYSWGPRFLVPLMPSLSLVALPIFEASLAPVTSVGTLIQRAAVAVILTLGFVVQVAGVAVDYNAYEVELDKLNPAPADAPFLYHHHPGLVYDVARSPILVHLRRLPSSELDFVWWPNRSAPPSVPNLISAIRSQQRAGDVIVYLAPELLGAFLNTPDLPPVYGLPVNVSPDDSLVRLLFDRAVLGASRVWLVTWHGAGDPYNWYEAQLRQTWASLSEETLDGYRLVGLARPPEQMPFVTDNHSFGPIRLTGYAVSHYEETLFVDLHWQAQARPDQDYITFVHLLSSDGNLVAGQDRQPIGGFRPTRTWRKGDEITDLFAFPVTHAGWEELQLGVGWYTWPSIERLAVTDEDGRRLEGDHLILAVPDG